MSLAVPIQPVTEMTKIKTIAEASMYETSASSKKKVGKVKKRSMSTTILLSTTPLKYPAEIPTIAPSSVAMSALMMPIVREDLPPSMMRASTSRPRRSVPKKCSKDGAKSTESERISKGLCV